MEKNMESISINDVIYQIADLDEAVVSQLNRLGILRNQQMETEITHKEISLLIKAYENSVVHLLEDDASDEDAPNVN